MHKIHFYSLISIKSLLQVEIFFSNFKIQKHEFILTNSFGNHILFICCKFLQKFVVFLIKIYNIEKYYILFTLEKS